MHNLARVWIAGCLATAATTASTVFNAILAVNNTSDDSLSPALRVLLFVGLGFSFLGSLSLVYFTVFYVRNVKSQYLHLKSAIWSAFGLGIGIGIMATAVPLVTLVWLVIEQSHLSTQTLGSTPAITWVAAWFGCCGSSILTQTTLFIILGIWVKHKTKRFQSTGRLDIDFGTRLPLSPPHEVQLVPDEHRSFQSRDTTLAELPRTPSTKRPTSSAQVSALPRPPAASSRTHLISHNLSAKSSMDMAFPAGEARVVDSAFDRWDTSSVHSEMRAAVGSSPLGRGGLETIPGSRPESPEDALDGPFLPSSPEQRPSSPRALTADTATALGDWSSSPTRYAATSSPPSSPPNFSRPTSKQKNQAMSAPLESPTQGTIHPLFRSSSPHPPPIATSGTVITASPMANQPITPRTLANLRSHNLSSSAVNTQPAKPTGHWRAMPSISQYAERRPSTSGSQGPGSPPPGSPGPSIVDEDELPPILPGFVLSAGQRSSMLGYANRKSIKSRRGSQMSVK